MTVYCVAFILALFWILFLFIYLFFWWVFETGSFYATLAGVNLRNITSTPAQLAEPWGSRCRSWPLDQYCSNWTKAFPTPGCGYYCRALSYCWQSLLVTWIFNFLFTVQTVYGSQQTMMKLRMWPNSLVHRFIEEVPKRPKTALPH